MRVKRIGPVWLGGAPAVLQTATSERRAAVHQTATSESRAAVLQTATL